MKYYLTSSQNDPLVIAFSTKSEQIKTITFSNLSENEINTEVSKLVREDCNANIVFSAELTEFIKNNDGLYERLANVLVKKEHRGIIRTNKGKHMHLHAYVA